MAIELQKAFDTRLAADLVSLEEGVMPHWSWDRTVLVGDAADKFTPSRGDGFNAGMVDVVVLTNQIHEQLPSCRAQGGAGCLPTKTQLSAAFKKYQDLRFDEVTKGCKGSGVATAMANWRSIMPKLIDIWLGPNYWFTKWQIDQVGAEFAMTPVFDFIEVEDEHWGKIPWAQRENDRCLG